MTTHPKTEEAYNLLHDGVLALARAERQGMRIDIEYATSKREHLTRKINRIEQKFRNSKFYYHWQKTRGNRAVNINSDHQLRHFLYTSRTGLNLQPTKTTVTGQGATDEEALSQLDIPELNTLIQLRKLRQLRDTYLASFTREAVRGYIHPVFNLHLARTYRSSSDHPNFQNIPSRNNEAMQLIRRALYPRPGHQLLEIDFSNLEVRIAACYHEDPTMIRYIKNPASDMHSDMAEQIFGIKVDRTRPGHNTLRAAAKNGFVFPQFYGDYYKNCAMYLAQKWGQLPAKRWTDSSGITVDDTKLGTILRKKGIRSLDAFIQHIKDIEHNFWQKRFPIYAAWKERWWTGYQRHGYIDMKTGFRCSGLMSRNDCINYPIQGTAFHCLLWSFIQLDRMMQQEKWDTRLVGQIHDSVILDVHPNELNNVATHARTITTQLLPQTWQWINVPLDIDAELSDVDCSWAEKKAYEL